MKKIISGGQTGADIAALKAAQHAGMETGGWCPPDCQNEAGPIPDKYGLKPAPRDNSNMALDIPRSLRTEWNVRDSDGTLLFWSGLEDPGTSWTRYSADVIYNKPVRLIYLQEKVPGEVKKTCKWIGDNHIEVLNVAGPSESSLPGTFNYTRQFVQDVLEQLDA